MNGTLALTFGGGWEWLVILIIALVVFGGYKKLPDVGSSMAASIRNFRKGMDEGKGGDEVPAATDPVTAETTTTKTDTRS